VTTERGEVVAGSDIALGRFCAPVGNSVTIVCAPYEKKASWEKGGAGRKRWDEGAVSPVSNNGQT